MNHGLSEKTVNKIFSVFERFPEIEKAVLYGSRAKGNFKTGSDIDLTLYGEKLSARLLGDIAEALDDLLLPYTIDLSIFDDLNHAKLREHIERVGVVFYEKKNQNMKAGWEIKTLGEVCEKASSNVSQNQLIDEIGNYPIYGASGFIKNVSFYHRDKDYISIVKDGAGIGRLALMKAYSSVIGTLQYLTPKDGLDINFLYYFLSSVDFLKYKNGSTIPHIYFKDYSVEPVPLPPLPEQKRLVTLLDEAFESIATAKANAEQNLKNARALYNSVLENLFSSLDDVETVELGELINTLTDYHANGGYEILKQNVELLDTEDFAWMVRSTDFEKNFENEKRYITKHAYDFLTKSKIFGGELIMSKIGNAGKLYLMPEITRPCSLAMNLFLIRLDESKASNKYVYRYLKSMRGEIQIQSKLKGAATQTITKESVRSLKIPKLSREIQDYFVSKLEDVELETQHLEVLYSRKIAALDELKKALLHRAFSGEL